MPQVLSQCSLPLLHFVSLWPGEEAPTPHRRGVPQSGGWPPRSRARSWRVMQAPPHAHVSNFTRRLTRHPPPSVGVSRGLSMPCTLLLGLGHFLGGQGVGARPVLSSGISDTELPLFWSQKSILMVPGWYLTPESSRLGQERPPSPCIQAQTSAASFVEPGQWGVGPAPGTCRGLVLCKWIACVCRGGWAGPQTDSHFAPHPGPPQLRSGPHTASQYLVVPSCPFAISTP